MISGVGIDLVEVARISEAIARWGDRFLRRVYTAAEIAACGGRADVARAFAARFAAKEAGMKALGTGWAAGVGWRDLEVVSCPGRPPSLSLAGEAARVADRLGARRVHLSLSHERGMAAAVVVLETAASSASQPTSGGLG